MAGYYCNPLPTFPQSEIERFWSQVAIGETESCWEWRGRYFDNNYGRFYALKKSFRAHRVAFAWTYGIDSAGLLVRHFCDNPRCCNPLHLSCGTPQDNSTDQKLRGRSTFGERNGRCKLSADLVTAIRQRHSEDGLSLRELAIEYGVTKTMIRFIVKRLAWRHIP